jgi:hypothetical protein
MIRWRGFGSAALIGDILTCPTIWVPYSVTNWRPVRKADSHATSLSR